MQSRDVLLAWGPPAARATAWLRRFPCRVIAVVGLAAVAASHALPPPASALPLFERSLGVECASCHDVVPHLNRGGAEFLQRGYRDDEGRGHPIWSAGTAPLSVVGYAGLAVQHTVGNGPGPREGFTTRSTSREEFQLHGAGALTNTLSFHVEGGFGRVGGSIRSDVAFLQINDVLSRGRANLRIGAFGSEFPFLSDSRRTTLQAYRSPVTLDARGFELNGRSAGWVWATGLIESHRHDASPVNEDKLFKHLQDTYVAITFNHSSTWLAGRMLFDRQDSSLPTLTWMQHLQGTAAGSLAVGPIVVQPAYVFDRFDDRPAAGIHDRHQHYLLEALAPIGTSRRWWLTTRYEHEYRTKTVLSPEEDHQLGLVNLGFNVSRNAGVALEWSRLGDNIGGARVDALDACVRLGY